MSVPDTSTAEQEPHSELLADVLRAQQAPNNADVVESLEGEVLPLNIATTNTTNTNMGYAGHAHPSALGGVVAERDHAEPQQGIIILPYGTTVGGAISHLSRNIKPNSYGLPSYYYRADLVATLLTMPHVTQADVDSCAEGLFYPDGYPVQASGAAFWTTLPCEQAHEHGLFQRYLQLAEDYGIRRLELLVGEAGIDLSGLQELFQKFYWSVRARAFDLYETAAALKVRELRIRKTEDKHFAKADVLMSQLMKRFEDPEWIEELTAAEAIDVLEALVKIQRLSVGLTGQHSSSNVGAPPPGAPAEHIVRRLVSRAGSGGMLQDNMDPNIRRLLDDPEQGMILQRMIIEVTSSHAPPSNAALGD